MSVNSSADLKCGVFLSRTLEGSQRNSDSHSSLYMSHLKCSSCGSQSPQHSDVCPNTSASRLAEEMSEMHSEYSDSSCGEMLSYIVS